MNYGRNRAKTDDPKDTEEEQSHQNPQEVAQDLVEGLLKKGYKLQAAIGGRHAGHDIYQLKTLEANPEIKYWARPEGSLSWVAFTAALNSVVESLAHNGTAYLEVARKLANNLTLQGNDKKTIMAGIAYSKTCYADPQTSRSLVGQLAHKQVPRLSWFPKLASLNIYNLLALFPKAEADLFLLILGRAMVGGGGTATLEGVINHKMRAAAILVGFQAGLGKSTLLSGLIAAARNCGYDACPVGSAGARFGWGKIAASDIAFKDDLNKKSQTDILKSETLKTIITGGSFSTERKAVDAEETKSNTTLICCSNDYNLYDFFEMDEGSVSRFNFLYTHNEVELNKLYPDFDARTDRNIARLAKEYGVTENTLYTLILAHGVERFLETLGVSVDGLALAYPGEDRLQETMVALRNKLTLASKISHVQSLMDSAANLIAFAIATQPKRSKRVDYYNELTPLGFDHPLLYLVINEYVFSKGSEPYRLEELAPCCREIIKLRLEELSNRRGDRSAAQAFAILAAELISTQGATYPKSTGFYYRPWVEAKKTIPELAEAYAKLMHDEDTNPSEIIDPDDLPQTTKLNLILLKELVKRPT